MPARNTFKTGPAIILYGSNQFWFKDGLTVTEELETFDINVDAYGNVDKRVKDKKITITGTPAGEWEALATLLPYLTVNIGTRIHGDTDKPLVVHALDGTRWTYANAAITGQPSLKLAATETIFGAVTWTARVKDNTEPTASNAYFTRDTATFPSSAFSVAAIKTQPYTGSWGTSPWDSFRTVDGFAIDFAVSLSDITADGYGVIDQMVTDVTAVAKFRPLGVTQAAIDAKLLIQGSGAELGGSLNARGVDLDITGTGVFVRLTAAAARKGGGEFATQKLRTGEIEAVATRSLSGGAALNIAIVDTAAPVVTP